MPQHFKREIATKAIYLFSVRRAARIEFTLKRTPAERKFSRNHSQAVVATAEAFVQCLPEAVQKVILR